MPNLCRCPLPKFNQLEMGPRVCIFQNTSVNFNVQPRYDSLRKAIFLVLLRNALVSLHLYLPKLLRICT